MLFYVTPKYTENESKNDRVQIANLMRPLGFDLDAKYPCLYVIENYRSGGLALLVANNTGELRVLELDQVRYAEGDALERIAEAAELVTFKAVVKEPSGAKRASEDTGNDAGDVSEEDPPGAPAPSKKKGRPRSGGSAE